MNNVTNLKFGYKYDKMHSQYIVKGDIILGTFIIWMVFLCFVVIYSLFIIIYP